VIRGAKREKNAHRGYASPSVEVTQNTSLPKTVEVHSTEIFPPKMGFASGSGVSEGYRCRYQGERHRRHHRRDRRRTAAAIGLLMAHMIGRDLLRYRCPRRLGSRRC
jgi:hypothetical protein